MIQFVPFIDSGSEGGAQATAERVAKQATAWLHHHGARYIGAVPTSNIVVSASGQTTLFYTLLVIAEVPGDQPAPWGDPSEPPEWKALGAPAAPPPAPALPPEDAAPALAATHAAIHDLMRRLHMTPEHAKLFLNTYHVGRISQLDATAAAAALAALQAKVQRKGVA